MTDLDLRAGQIHRGLGVVARWPDIALVIPSDAAHDATVDEMFHSLGPAPTSPDLVSAINTLLSDGKLQSVAMLVEATGGPLAMAFGPAEVLVDGEPVLDGTRGGVRQQLPQSAHRLTIRAANLSKAAEPVAPYDLRRGIAPGAGLTLITVALPTPAAPSALRPASPVPPPSAPKPAPPAPAAPAPTPPPPEPPVSAEAPPPPVVEEPPAPAAAPPGVRSGRFSEADMVDGAASPQVERAQPAVAPNAIAVPFRSVLLTNATPSAVLAPLPLADSPKTGELSRIELDAGRVEVEGALCARDHFNNPAAAYCMVCGLPMQHLTDNLVRGPRPTLGFIVFDDGSTFGLDRSYVIGREPVIGDSGESEPLILHDNNETLSRTHAELRIEEWNLQLVDLESTNGTYIWDQTFERWNQLAPGHPVVLNSGDTVALGRRTFVFESVSRS